MRSTSSFNHSLTGFALEGKHRVLDCRQCHDSKWGSAEGYKNFDNIKPVSCKTCHDDTHEGRLGDQCKNCHSQQSFTVDPGRLSGFDHGITGFALKGKHTATDCRNCHKGRFMTEALSHDRCNQCHSDYHKGEFAGTPYNDCASCHSEESFASSSFDMDRHETAAFRLGGAHMATPCFSCHRQEDRWAFRNIGKACVDCHENIHKGHITDKYLPDNDCTRCHSTESWVFAGNFDHGVTDFALKGAHLRTSCSDCHFSAAADNLKIQKFVNLDSRCVSCHNNVHGNQFEVEGATDCARCHGFEKWDRSNFNHDNARFRLEGAHLQADCNQCHPKTDKDGVVTVQYKTGKLLCTDCHM